MKQVLLLTTSTLPTSLLLGALGVLLFDDVGWGLNLPIFAIACYLAVLHAMRAHGNPGGRETALAGAIAVVWSSVFVWRDSPVLHSLAGLSLAATLYFVHLQREFGSLSMPVSALFRCLPAVVHAFLRGPVCALRQELNGTGTGHSLHAVHSLAVARGVLLSVPLLVLFGWLLISADARFAERAWDFFTLDLASLFLTVLTFSVCFWMAIFLLRARTVRLGAERGAHAPALQPLEVTTALFLLNFLLALYMAVQLTYFVGGDALVRTTQSLTYADYARRGFSELVAVAGLTVPVLLCADWLCETARGRIRAAQHFATVTTIVLVTMIAGSAAHRLLLYADAYGLTEPRVYAAAALLWVVVLLVWIAWTVLRGQRDRFLCGAFASALGVAAGLLLVNPDARIATYNLGRAVAGQPLDTDYLLSLSADAVPAIVAARRGLDRDQRLTVESELLLRALAYRAPAWQGWNWARYRANHAVFTTAPVD